MLKLILIIAFAIIILCTLATYTVIVAKRRKIVGNFGIIKNWCNDHYIVTADIDGTYLECRAYPERDNIPFKIGELVKFTRKVNDNLYIDYPF